VRGASTAEGRGAGGGSPGLTSEARKTGDTSDEVANLALERRGARYNDGFEAADDLARPRPDR
jgi:hypothetical protein